MTGPTIIETFEKLKQHRHGPAWLWSMLLTRGLTWGNVWSVFVEGVASSVSGSPSSQSNVRVPGLAMLMSLPDAPNTVQELFHRLQDLRAHYPASAKNNHYVLDVERVAEQLIDAMQGRVQCTLPQVKAVLDASREGSDDGQLSDVAHMMKTFCDKKPALRVKALHWMVETQHPMVGMYDFVRMVRDCDSATAQALWNTIASTPWANAELTKEFMRIFFCKNPHFTIPVEQSLAFIQRHPELIPGMVRAIQAYAWHNTTDDAFFATARALLAPYPAAFIELHATMKKALSLAQLQSSTAQDEKLEARALMQAYTILAREECTSPEACSYFARAFQGVALRVVDNEPALREAVVFNPMGALPRVLALHACRVGLFSNDYSGEECKAVKALFHHDPASKTGQAAIIEKCIPELKNWFAVARDLGLNSNDVWQQGLQTLALEPPDASVAIDSAFFARLES